MDSFKEFKNYKIDVPYLSKTKISLLAENIYNHYKSNNGKLEIIKILNDFNISLVRTSEILNLDTIAEINFNQKDNSVWRESLFRNAI